MYYRDLVTGSPTTTHTVRKISFGITLLNAFNDYRSLIVQSDYKHINLRQLMVNKYR